MKGKRPVYMTFGFFFLSKAKMNILGGITCSVVVIYDKDFIVQYFLPERRGALGNKTLQPIFATKISGGNGEVWPFLSTNKMRRSA